jgi:hypothetical protein
MCRFHDLDIVHCFSTYGQRSPINYMLHIPASALSMQASIVPNSPRRPIHKPSNPFSPSHLNFIHSLNIPAPVFSYHSLSPLSSSSSILPASFHCTTMPGDLLEGRYIRLEGESLHNFSYLFRDLHPLSTVVSGKNIKVPSWRIPACIYVSINLDSSRRWKSAIGILSSDESMSWADTVTYKFMETFRYNPGTNLFL